MVIQNQEVDYAMDKARVDAEGFDMLQALKPQCDLCGEVINDGEEIEVVKGLQICEVCLNQEGVK